MGRIPHTVSLLVPWSSLWHSERLVASTTSLLGLSSTCLHHCRGVSRPSTHTLALADTYNLDRGERDTQMDREREGGGYMEQFLGIMLKCAFVIIGRKVMHLCI